MVGNTDAAIKKDPIFPDFRELAAEVLGVKAAEVEPDKTFAEDLDADSLDLVELVMALEEKFDISVDEKELEDIKTVGQAFEMVKSKL